MINCGRYMKAAVTIFYINSGKWAYRDKQCFGEIKNGVFFNNGNLCFLFA